MTLLERIACSMYVFISHRYCDFETFMDSDLDKIFDSDALIDNREIKPFTDDVESFLESDFTLPAELLETVDYYLDALVQEIYDVKLQQKLSGTIVWKHHDHEHFLLNLMSKNLRHNNYDLTISDLADKLKFDALEVSGSLLKICKMIHQLIRRDRFDTFISKEKSFNQSVITTSSPRHLFWFRYVAREKDSLNFIGTDYDETVLYRYRVYLTDIDGFELSNACKMLTDNVYLTEFAIRSVTSYNKNLGGGADIEISNLSVIKKVENINDRYLNKDSQRILSESVNS